MPSDALLDWRNVRMARLAEIDAQCAASMALTPPQPNLVEENLRGYVLLLSATSRGSAATSTPSTPRLSCGESEHRFRS